jgi:DNA-binding LacI/PurR family transcriptional regulator
VKEVMAELSYHPNAVAQSLSRQKTFPFVGERGLRFIVLHDIERHHQ